MKTHIICTAILSAMLLSGCSTMVQHNESTLPFGSSAKLAVRQQIYNPEAGGDAPVVGLDGRYAESVHKKYLTGPVTEAKDGMSVSEIIIGGK